MTSRLSTRTLARAAALLLTVGAAQAFDDAKYPDFKGKWERVGAPRWLAPGQKAPLTPEYQAVYAANRADMEAGGVGDVVKFVDRWKEYISEGDRYLNPHLTRADPSCGLARAGEKDDWNRWYATLTTP